ncbi:aldo/keto reductase, partial [Adlercreutzia sp. DFI.6.23]|uniref:aldo/keto reductase n=1 Tax=Adlercreutzia sp. DFI.6.23 TaxID=2963705 RepID=UPI00210C6EC3
MDAGFTYFDSARGYHGCKSEWALCKALVERYPRDSFTIATKLPAWLVRTPTRPAPCSTPPLRSAASTTSTITCCTTWARPS